MLEKLLSLIKEASFQEGVLLSIVSGAILGLGGWLFKAIKNFILKRFDKHFMDGIWVTDFRTESNSHAIEIYKIYVEAHLFKKNDVRKLRFHVQHFTEGGRYPIIFADGFGTFHGRNIILIYYTRHKNINRTGSIILKVKDMLSDTFLEGNYHEFYNEKLATFEGGDLIFRKVSLGLWSRIKMALKLPVAKSYPKIKAKVNDNLLSFLTPKSL